jgi:hypothetical protein
MPERLTTKEFISRAIAIHGSRYDYSKVSYFNAETKICIIGERDVINWFNKHRIAFDQYYSFPDLVSPKGKPLRFDFCTRHVKFLIEFDGEQHFRPVRFNSISEESTVEKFEKVQYYDSLKDQYCIKNNIPLIRISYKEFNDVPEILSEKLLGIGAYFQKHGSLKFSVNELQGVKCISENLTEKSGTK